MTIPATALPGLDRSIRILVVETDPVMQSGLVVCLNRFGDLQVVAEADRPATALMLLTTWRGTSTTIDLVLLGLPLDLGDRQLSASAFCQQIKTIYPDLPILLLAPPQDPDLQIAFQLGVEGCCLRGSSILDLVQCLRLVAAGRKAWNAEIDRQLPPLASRSDIEPPHNFRDRWRSAGLEQIEIALAQVTTELKSPQISALNRLFLTGRSRELNTARWLVSRLLATAQTSMGPPPATIEPLDLLPPSTLPTELLVQTTAPEITPKALQGELFDQILLKLQANLDNLTSIPLEIDLLRVEKKRELFYLILRQIEILLDELCFSQITISQLASKQTQIWQDLWASVTMIFFGKYHTILVKDLQVEIVPILLESREIVQTEMLAKIPHSINLLNYLLFQIPLTINNTVCQMGTPVAAARACALLENLTIELANAVMQPLLDRFANLDEVKSAFFDRRLQSTREIEKFRNDLSWRYRIDRYVYAPQAIFESQYRLFIFTDGGIDRITIYAPRAQELASLTGIPFAVTLALETRDAIAPRLKSATALFGGILVYLLTEIIGRGIGLIGRGVIKGIGNIWQESNRSR